jgi:hypothetical protein
MLLCFGQRSAYFDLASDAAIIPRAISVKESAVTSISPNRLSQRIFSQIVQYAALNLLLS